MINFSECSNEGLSIHDIRQHKDTVHQRELSKPAMLVVEVKEDFNLTINNQVFEFREEDILVIQYNLYYSILQFLIRDKKENALTFHNIKFKDLYNRYLGESLDNKNIFVMTTSIGDTIFMQPVMKYIKEKWPTCKITLAAGKTIKELLQCYPKGLVDEIYSGAMFVEKEVIMENDYHMYPNFFITKNSDSHKINCYDIFKDEFNLNFDIKNYYPELIPRKYILDEVKKYIPKNPYIVLQIRASTGNRMLPPQSWMPIIREIVKNNFDVVFVDDEHFKELYNKDFLNQLPDCAGRVHNLCKYIKSMKQTIGIIASSDGVIGIDSALIHIGAALNKPIIGIYGPFRAEVRLKYYKNCEWVEPKNLECECAKWPCFFHQDEISQQLCEYMNFHLPPQCMMEISIDEIIEKFHKLFLSKKSIKIEKLKI